MNKKARIELVQNALTGIMTQEDLNKFDERIIGARINDAYNSLLIDAFLKKLINIDGYTKQYRSVAVTKDATTDRYFSVIPAKLVPLPNIQDAVRSINTTQGIDLSFVPISSEHLSLVQTLDMGRISTMIGYTLIQYDDDLLVEYLNMPVTITSVLMRLVIPFEEYSDTDEVRIPGNSNMLMDAVIKSLSITPKKDLKINSSDIKD
jgi:hypothetical protein